MEHVIIPRWEILLGIEPQLAMWECVNERE